MFITSQKPIGNKNMKKKKLAHHFRSNFEFKFSNLLDENNLQYEYEKDKVKYVKNCTYTPDFKIGNLYIETKGRFLAADRAKHLLIREQNPGITIIFVFMNPNVTLTKTSKTTYWMWADKHNFLWTTADKSVKFIQSVLSSSKKQ